MRCSWPTKMSDSGKCFTPEFPPPFTKFIVDLDLTFQTNQDLHGLTTIV